ncbi:MAG: type II CRISPR RNA-guided endonuclease Cas9 [Robiginitomaculum sp.]
MKWRLGLDLGSNSLGWAVIRVTKADDGWLPNGVEAAGVRIFSDGRNAKSKASNAAERREPRSARRNRDRYKNRRKRLFNELVQFGLMPEGKPTQKELEKIDPWILRAQGLNQEIDIHQLGRALFHLHQRRGFKSNRKTDKGDSDSGKVAEATKLTLTRMQEKNARTLGELFGKPRLDALEFNKTAPKGNRKPQPLARVRTHGEGAKWGYDYYPTRALIEHEFDELWKSQSKYHSGVLTDKAKTALKETLLFQWPLKPQPVGKCTLLPEEPRAAKALPSSQLVRIYQEVNNLRVGHTGRIDRPLEIEERDIVVEKLKTTGKPTFPTLRKTLKIPTGQKFNLESEKRKYLDGDKTATIMKSDKRWGKAWLELSLVEQDKIITKLLDEESEEKVIDWLRTKYKFDKDRAKAIADANLPASYGMLSAKAINKLLPVFKAEVIVYDKAVKKAFDMSHSNFETGEIFDKALPYYGEILTRSVAFGTGEIKDLPEKRYGKLANPTVHVSMNQIRAVINDLLKRYGAPEQIVLELARDLPLSAQGKKELESNQKKNQEANEKRAKQLQEEFQCSNSYENRMRLKLWEEMAAMDRACVFTGAIISREMLFTAEVEIEHLLPFSWSFDDGIGNKVLCLRRANRDKKNQTPYEAFGHSPDGYDWEAISQRAAELPYNKRWRFSENARETFEKDHKGFLPRQLTDTRYIARLAAQYVGAIFGGQGHKGIENKVWTVNGRLTSDLRWHWGLDSVLAGHNSGIGDKEYKKNRNDHRHHAIDAIVIALTDRSMVQKASKQAKQNREKWDNRLLSDLKKPWKGFRDDVVKAIGDIKVSHKPDHGVQGAMLKAGAMSIIPENDKKSNTVPLVRKYISLDTITSKILDAGNTKTWTVVDENIRRELNHRIMGLSEKEVKLVVLEWGKEQSPSVKRLRVYKRESVEIIGGYKAYSPASNYCFDIAVNKKGKWLGNIINAYKAYQQKNKVKKWDWWKNMVDLDGKPIIMRLRKNDMLQITDEEGKTKLVRVYKFSGNSVHMHEHFEANHADRIIKKDLTDIKMATSSLQKAKARRATISPSGVLRLY